MRKIAVALTALVMGVLAFLVPGTANAGSPGYDTGWHGSTCNGTYDNSYAINLRVKWQTNNDRLIYVSGYEFEYRGGPLYTKFDEILIYAALPGGSWNLKYTVTYDDVPYYGQYTYFTIPSYHLTSPGSETQWIAKGHWAGDYCSSPKLYN